MKWHGCYDLSWKGVIVPDAFKHPAKCSRALIDRIFRELFAMGALKEGDTIVDPFGGIGTSLLTAANRGVKAYGCELEPKFAALAWDNIAQHTDGWQQMRKPIPQMVCGDSRRLREHLFPVFEADGLISSPPYAEIASGAGGLNSKPAKAGQQGGRSATSPSQNTDQRYGDHAGQMAKMPTGAVSDVVVFAPDEKQQRSTIVEHSQPRGVHGQVGSADPGTPLALRGQGLLSEATREALQRPPSDYPEGNGSVRDSAEVEGPPRDAASQFQTREIESAVSNSDHEGQVQEVRDHTEPLRAPQKQRSLRQQAGEPGNTVQPLSSQRDEAAMVGRQECRSTAADEQWSGGMVEAVVSSPPFTQGFSGGGGINKRGYNPEGGDGADNVGDRSYQGTGAERSPRNLETMTFDEVADAVTSRPVNADTFWFAAKDIVSESYAILKPGGHAVWIVKHFVRDKAIVDFPGDWQRLCEFVGFELVQEVHAMLVKETSNNDLFDGETVVEKSRKSFFRRLAEKKGSPRIDFETVLIMRKPA